MKIEPAAGQSVSDKVEERERADGLMDARNAVLFLMAGAERPFMPCSRISNRQQASFVIRQVLAAKELPASPPTYLVQHETADLAVPLALCPDNEYIGDRCVRDPGLCARDEESATAGSFARFGSHASRVCMGNSVSARVDAGQARVGGTGTVIRLGQAEAADEFSRCESREVLFLELLRAEGVCFAATSQQLFLRPDEGYTH